ncbi:hypothetical protein ACR6C2_38565 [Streptomyces sp. INA 01156]
MKPHDSAGSMGLSVLHSEGELRAYLADDAAHGLYGPDRPACSSRRTCRAACAMWTAWW